jgi:hypothetical protein
MPSVALSSFLRHVVNSPAAQALQVPGVPVHSVATQLPLQAVHLEGSAAQPLTSFLAHALA